MNILDSDSLDGGFMATIGHQLFRFAIVGAFGFVVDAAVLSIALSWSNLGLYWGRVVSFAVAATFTWWANRRFVFGEAGATNPLKQWLRFLAANSLGALVNYATYAVAVSSSTAVATWPVVGVALGSIAGLAFNFISSRAWVFR
ncbi:MAG: GtrA family protein [Rhodospirillaceae bacterium]|nr:GtrA family protein [Rhodospirillaceae bacterium]